MGYRVVPAFTLVLASIFFLSATPAAAWDVDPNVQGGQAATYTTVTTIVDMGSNGIEFADDPTAACAAMGNARFPQAAVGVHFLPLPEQATLAMALFFRAHNLRVFVRIKNNWVNGGAGACVIDTIFSCSDPAKCVSPQPPVP